MSILDEDIGNFNKDDTRYEYYSKVIKECLPDARVLVPNCYRISCADCIGHKHDITNGCPVCGSKSIHHFAYSIIERIYRCEECGSIAALCISAVAAVGINEFTLPDVDDVI